MDLQTTFTNALTYTQYITLLNENADLHNLHYRKFELPPDVAQAPYLQYPWKILAITEPWCGDSLALLPIVRKLYEASQKWQFKIILRDENNEVIDQFLTNGSRAIPIFLFLGENFELLNRWGPRPKVAQQIFEDHRSQIQAGAINKEDVIRKIRTFYAKDRGVHAIRELHQLLMSTK